MYQACIKYTTGLQVAFPSVYYIVLGIRIGLSAPLADRPYCRFCGSFANELRNARGAGIFCLFSSLLLSSPFFFLSLLVVTQMRGHIAGRSPPPPHYGFVPYTFVARIFQLFLTTSTRIELHCCAAAHYSPTHAI